MKQPETIRNLLKSILNLKVDLYLPSVDKEQREKHLSWTQQ